MKVRESTEGTMMIEHLSMRIHVTRLALVAILAVLAIAIMLVTLSMA
jgi:hypothetical protein